MARRRPARVPPGWQQGLLRHVDVDAILAAPENAGRSPEEIADKVIDAIAAATPWSAIFPGVGALIDAAEAAVVKGIAHGIIVALAKKRQPSAASKE